MFRETKTSEPLGKIIEGLLSRYLWNVFPEPKRYWALVVLVGVTSGYLAFLLEELLDLVQLIAWGRSDDIRQVAHQTARTSRWSLILVLTSGGFFVTLIRNLLGQKEQLQGTAHLLEALAFKRGRIPFLRTCAEAFSSIVAVGTGASLGREGAMIHSGAATGSLLGVKLRLEDHHVKVLVACGAAGGIAAAYNVPIGASVFAMEVLLGSFALELFGPIIVCSVISTTISHVLLGSSPAYEIPAQRLVSEQHNFVNEWEIFLHLLLGVGLGIISAVFIRIFSQLDVFFRWLQGIDRIKPLIAMMLVGVAGVFVPDILGNGYDTVNLVLSGENVEEVFPVGILLLLPILKIIATALCRAGGVPGGLFTPSLFIGALLGTAFGVGVNHLFPAGSTAAPSAYALVGMGAILAGTIQAPITAVLMIFEMTRDYGIILPIMAASVASTLVSHFLNAGSLYTEPLKRRGIRLPGASAPTWIQQPTIRSVLQSHVTTVSPAERFEKVMDTFLSTPEGQDRLYVTSREGAYLGSISLHEIKRFFRETENLESVIAADIVDASFPYVFVTDPISRAIEILSEKETERLPVLDGPDSKKLLGTVSKRTLLAAYTEANLPHQQIRAAVPEPPGKGPPAGRS